MHRYQRFLVLITLLTLAAMLLGGCNQANTPTATVEVRPTPAKTPTAQAALVPTLGVTATAAQAPTAATATLTKAPTTTPLSATVASATRTSVQRPTEGVALTVLHTNDVAGYIDPCG